MRSPREEISTLSMKYQGWYVERIVFPKEVHILIPETCECVAYVEKGLCRCDTIKDHKVRRLCWII